MVQKYTNFIKLLYFFLKTAIFLQFYDFLFSVVYLFNSLIPLRVFILPKMLVRG